MKKETTPFDRAHVLIPVHEQKIDGVSSHVIDGRSLHWFLGVDSQFCNWIQRRIKQYGFTEGIDYHRFKVTVNAALGCSKIEYHVSLDMAKELAIVERTNEGREARNYLIEYERQMNSALVPSLHDLEAQRDMHLLRAKVLLLQYKVATLADSPRRHLSALEGIG